MPLFGSGASKIILCFPLIRFSHVSNDASAPVVGSGRGCPSSLSGVSPATPAAAVAARRPRNPRLYMRSLLVVRPDRKSTRLNSSHSQISYAVFCLKKKTNSYYHPQWDAERVPVVFHLEFSILELLPLSIP